jgi:hypothetical protein
MDNIVPITTRMSERDYERARRELGERKDAGAKWDQQLALLFARSNWTQEQLAEKEGKSQFWISKRLLFGRFLNFIAKDINPEIPIRSLTERAFRKFWERTEGGNERQRFAAVLKLMQDGTFLRQPPVLKGLGKAIAAEFADGKWHKLETIVTATERSEDDVSKVLGQFGTKREWHTYGISGCDVKPVGKSKSYRIFPAINSISSVELAEKLGPIIEALIEEGKKNMATMSPGTVAKLAHNLKQLLEQWTK